ncbi:MAG: lysophospholipid acyltransferase family protein [Ktedonobacterales bacterium]
MAYYLIRFASWLAGKVPRKARLAIAGSITILVYYGWVSKRRFTIENMAQILGTSSSDPQAHRLARISWRNFGRYISDFIYIPNTTREAIVARLKDTIPPPGSYALVDKAREAGKGVILVSTHFGAYDVAAIAVANYCPVHLIVETLSDPRMDNMWQEQRRQLGIEVLRIEKTPRQILRILQENGVVGVAVDRPVSPGEGVPIQFFGRECWVPGGIAQIALKSGAAILPGYCIYDEDYSTTYYFGAGPIIWPEPTRDRKADATQLTQRMFDALEVQIRERPDQWAMFRRFWPSQAHDKKIVLETKDASASQADTPVASSQRNRG